MTEGHGIIEDISIKQGAKGDYFKLAISRRSYSVFSGTNAFTALSEKQFKKGDSVEFEYTESPGQYQGKDITYKNIQEMIKAEGSKNLDEKSEELEASIPAELPSPKEIAKEAIEVSNALLEGIDCEGTAEIVATRKDVFAELMTDRRTQLIQSYKKSNIKEMRYP